MTWFVAATFDEDARFDGATFTGARRLFAGAAFARNAEFVGASFARDAEFIGATFTRHARFGGATFGQRPGWPSGWRLEVAGEEARLVEAGGAAAGGSGGVVSTRSRFGHVGMIRAIIMPATRGRSSRLTLGDQAPTRPTLHHPSGGYDTVEYVMLPVNHLIFGSEGRRRGGPGGGMPELIDRLDRTQQPQLMRVIQERHQRAGQPARSRQAGRWRPHRPATHGDFAHQP